MREKFFNKQVSEYIKHNPTTDQSTAIEEINKFLNDKKILCFY